MVVAPLNVLFPVQVLFAAPFFSIVVIPLKVLPFKSIVAQLADTFAPKVVPPKDALVPAGEIVPLFTLPLVKVAVPVIVKMNVFRSNVPELNVRLVMERVASSTGENPDEVMTASSAAKGNPVFGVQFKLSFHAEELLPFQVYVVCPKVFGIIKHR